MKHRFLIHSLNHTVLVIDATPIGLHTEIYPPEGKSQSLTSLRFQSWLAAEQFLLGAGADPEVLRKTREKLKATSLAILTVPS
jgi:hypothetical protein